MSWASDRSFHIKTSACKVLLFLIFSYGHQQWVASWSTCYVCNRSREWRLKNSRFFWFRDLSISNRIIYVVAANYIDFSLVFLAIHLLSLCVLASKSSVCGKTQSTMKQSAKLKQWRDFDGQRLYHDSPPRGKKMAYRKHTSSRSSAVKPSVELCFPGVCNKL